MRSDGFKSGSLFSSASDSLIALKLYFPNYKGMHQKRTRLLHHHYHHYHYYHYHYHQHLRILPPLPLPPPLLFFLLFFPFTIHVILDFSETQTQRDLCGFVEESSTFIGRPGRIARGSSFLNLV